VNSEVINALLCLLDKGVSHHFPVEVFSDAVYFFKRLINWNRAVTYNPFTRFVNVSTSSKVHDRITAPASCPNQLFYFFN
jgi:hypothetical protein